MIELGATKIGSIGGLPTHYAPNAFPGIKGGAQVPRAIITS